MCIEEELHLDMCIEEKHELHLDMCIEEELHLDMCIEEAFSFI